MCRRNNAEGGARMLDDEEADEEVDSMVIEQITKRIKKSLSNELIKTVLVKFGEQTTGTRNVLAERLAEQMYLETDDEDDDP
jgi:hypothetical protein